MSAPARPPLPLVVVCEDGDEYLERFRRFLGEELRLVPTRDFASARAACTRPDAPPLALVLDLDFRRLAPERLVDEQGATAPARPGGEAQRLAQIQGVLILRALRAQAVATPALLFADLDDPARAAFLEKTLAPLTIVRSTEGLGAIAARLRALPAGP
jgi:hypothetical protein